MSRRLVPLLAILAVGLVLPAAASAVPGAASTVFVNEFHYDNSGTDVGEFIEIAAPAGTNLSGYSLVLYNGSGGAAYDTRALSGVVAEQNGGYGTVSFAYPSSGIQNGAPDGIALAQGGTVVQFLSYEGTFTAVGGPASGSTSTNVGVSETGSANGTSIALRGTGDMAGDFTFALDTNDTPAAVNNGQTFTGGGTTSRPPSVTGTTPGNGASNVDPAANLSVTFSEPVTAADGAFALNCGGTALTVTVSGSGTTFTIDPDAALPAGKSCTLTVEADRVTDADGANPASDTMVSFTTASGAALRPSDVQGSGPTTPREGETVTVEGVVTRTVAAGSPETVAGEPGAFFAQNLTPDGDEATSDGVVVVADTAGLAPGDSVRFTGTAGESFGLTRVVVSSVTETGSAAVPTPVALTLPADTTERERREGMLVDLGTLSVTELRNAEAFGELRLSSGGVLEAPTDAAEPGGAATAVAAENVRRNIILDDGAARNPRPVPYVNDAPNPPLRRGDEASNLIGALSFGFSNYRLQATATPEFTERNPRPASPDDVGGDLQVGSYNVENYFITFDGDSRGADDQAEFERQQAKVVAGIEGLGAEVVSLEEIQDTSGGNTFGGTGNPDLALADLVEALNEDDPGNDKWAFVPLAEPDNNTDVIRTAIIYQPAVVERVGPARTFEDPAFDNARDPQAQTFRVLDATEPSVAEVFTVVANHFKSKSGTGTGDNLDTGQGSFNGDRSRQATALLGFVETLQTASGDDDVFLLGDLNAYENEEPIDILLAGGLEDSGAELANGDRYSLVFDGAQGRLDYALATPGLNAKLTGADIWHINADESEIFGYDGATPEEGTPFRASDHDPTLVGLADGCTITGTDAGETLTGTSGDDVICALGGNDSVFAGEGDDIVIGGTGDDTILDGAGDDSVEGGIGNDVFGAEAGDDVYTGGTGQDRVTYATRTATVTATLGADGGNGVAGEDDSIGTGIEELRGGAGDDTLTGDGSSNTITGQRGVDRIFGLGGNDRLRGDEGDDEIEGGDGNDTIEGQAGADTLLDGTGLDLLLGGDGDDTQRSTADGVRDDLNCGNGRDTFSTGESRDAANRNCEVRAAS